MDKKYLILTITLITMCLLHIFSQEEKASTPTISYEGTGSYWMVERSDLRRYDNGRYTGLMQREVRSFVHPISAPPKKDLNGDIILIASKNAGIGSWFDGSFFVSEKTLSNQQQTALGLSGAIPATFFISPDGMLLPIQDNGFPSFRSFPAFPQEELKPGDTWTAEAIRSVDPLNKGAYTKLPMNVQYTFVGEEEYLGEEVFRIKAQWATRYGQSNWDFDGDSQLIQAMGSHKANIIVLKDTGAAILIQDSVDETFKYANGQTVQFKGNINLFTEFPPSVNTEEILPSLGKIASIAPNTNIQQTNTDYDYSSVTPATESFSETDLPNAYIPQENNNEKEIDASGLPLAPELTTNNMLVEKTPAGLRLSIRNIQFLPDSAEFAPEESSRLDMIAETLASIPGAQFLVEGHSASVGNPRGEKQLSIERAQKIVEELSLRGIKKDQFITNGFGSERPIASNDSFEGREANRRVEITILE